jgi:hypothetical protein
MDSLKTFSAYSNFGISSTVGILSLPLLLLLLLPSIEHSSSYSLDSTVGFCDSR